MPPLSPRPRARRRRPRLRRLRRRAAATARELAAEIRELALEPAAVLDQRIEPRRQFLRRYLEFHGGLTEQRLLVSEMRFGCGAGQRLDAAHARRHRALRDDLEEPDVAGAAHMGAAAELDREVPR